METAQPIEALTRHYFELCGQADENRLGKAKFMAEQKTLEREIFSRPAENIAALHEKARLLAYLMEEKGGASGAAGLESFFTNVLQDILRLCKDEKLSPSGSYGPEAAASYYRWMFSGWH
jgi:hypothetical protein